MTLSKTTFSRVKIIALIIGIVALVIGQGWASIVHWLRIPPDTFAAAAATSCRLVPICNLDFPPYFGPIFLILLLAVILLALAMRATVLRVTRDVEAVVVTPVRPIARARYLSVTLAVISLVASIAAFNDALTAPTHYPNPLLWLLVILLWGITFYSLDRANGRSAPFSRRNLLSLLAYVILLVALGFAYGAPALQVLTTRVLFVLISSLIAGGLWRARLISGVAAVFAVIAIVGLAVATYNITSWRYSFWGDEYSYYNNDRVFLASLALGKINVLGSHGIYRANPIFGTFIQAVLLQVFGLDIYSWRFGNLLMVYLAAPAIFWLGRRLKGSGAGLVAVIVFVSSHYLIALSHVGYIQPELLPVFTAMLVFAVIGLEKRSALAIYLSGVAGALSFFTFILGFPLIPTPFLLLAIWVFWSSRQLPFLRRFVIAFQLGVICLIGVWTVAFPRAANTAWIRDAGFETVFQSQVTDITNPLTQQMLPNVIYTLGASLYFDQNSHYTSGAHLDPVSSALLIAGIAGLIAAATKRRIALWLLLSFLAAAFVVGGLVPYPYPPHTRAYLMEVYYAIFAAVGAGYLWETVRDLGLRLSPALLRVGLAAAGIAIITLNAYQFFYLSELDVPKTRIALVMQQFEQSTPNTTIYYAAQVPTDANLTMVIQNNAYDPSRLKPITDPAPFEAFAHIRQTATAPYRIVIEPDLTHLQIWLAAARVIWPTQVLQTIWDPARIMYQVVIDVPS